MSHSEPQFSQSQMKSFVFKCLDDGISEPTKLRDMIESKFAMENGSMNEAANRKLMDKLTAAYMDTADADGDAGDADADDVNMDDTDTPDDNHNSSKKEASVNVNEDDDEKNANTEQAQEDEGSEEEQLQKPSKQKSQPLRSESLQHHIDKQNAKKRRAKAATSAGTNSKNGGSHDSNQGGILGIDSHETLLGETWSKNFEIFGNYNLLMNQTDVNFGERGHNKFYAIQILQHRNKFGFKFVTKWGRVGQKGQISSNDYDREQDAIHAFAKKFKDKTKNVWGAPVFRAVDGKYIPISMNMNMNMNMNVDTGDDDADADADADDADADSDSDFDVDQENNNKKKKQKKKTKTKKKKKNKTEDEDEDEIDAVPASKLQAALIQMLSLIFDEQLQIDTAQELNIDVNRMPLGQLSKQQIDKGYSILCKINEIVVDSHQHRGKLMASNKRLGDLSSKFYTVIPHNFGMRRPPIINTAKKLHSRIELIQCLKEMLITNSILKKRSKRLNPIDVHYRALHCHINRISDVSNEYQALCQSIQGTHASTHNGYTLQVVDIFDVDRQGSKFRHLPFRRQFGDHRRENNDSNDSNADADADADASTNPSTGGSSCKLLFHGSRLSNFVGILSQGLRIAPPEAPSTGYMFGKGLYFADCASKSANYIRATHEHPYGLLVVAEVAVGTMYPLLKARYLIKPPLGYHSVIGVGKHIPKSDSASTSTSSSSEFVTEIDDYELSLGPMIANPDANVQQNGELLYNEYIVYDIAQVRMKYLALIKFDFQS